MSDSAHLKPGFVRPSLSRPPKQRWASWVRDYRPESVEGKAAKSYSYGYGSLSEREIRRVEDGYKAWLARPLAERQAEEQAARERRRNLEADRAEAVPVVKRRGGRKLGAVAGGGAVSPELTAALARIAELEERLAKADSVTRRFGLVRAALEALAA